MHITEQREIAKRLLKHYQNGSTEYAPHWIEFPADRYYSDEQARLEHEYVFGRYPLAVALSGDLPAPRSWFAVDWTPTPILLVRGEDGDIRAFANVCRHRGMAVASGRGDGARRFTCPYHAWTYDTKGKLVGVPMAEGFVDLPKDECGLIPLPVAERYGIILVRCRPGEEIDAEAHFAGLGPELESWGLADKRLLKEHDRHHMPGNWKICWDTFNETYHVPYLHPDTLALFVLGNCLAVDTFGPHSRMATPIKSLLELEDQPEDEWEVVPHVSFQYRMLPNWSFTIAYDHISFYQLFPGREPNTTTAIRGIYIPKDATEEEAKAAYERSNGFWVNVLIPQDFSVVEKSSYGLASDVVPKTYYGANEPALMHLHQQLEKVITEGLANDERSGRAASPERPMEQHRERE